MSDPDTTVVHSHGPHLIVGCADAVIRDGQVIALTLDPTYGQRIAELLDRHGLIDVPDDASAINERTV